MIKLLNVNEVNTTIKDEEIREHILEEISQKTKKLINTKDNYIRYHPFNDYDISYNNQTSYYYNIFAGCSYCINLWYDIKRVYKYDNSNRCKIIDNVTIRKITINLYYIDNSYYAKSKEYIVY